MAKNIMITGATDGLGQGLADRLAADGHRLVLHGRDRRRLDAAADRAESLSGIRPKTVRGDLARLDDVAAIVSEVDKVTDRIDVLINNAGVGPGNPNDHARALSADGHELRLAVNYLAPFALTLGLAGLLGRGVAPRVVNVASDGQARVDLENLMLVEGYSGELAYCRSKLALIAFSLSLSERWDVAVNSVHPGSAMPTKMVDEIGVDTIDTLHGGVEAVCRVAIDPSLEGVSGRYFNRMREDRAHEQVYDLDFRRALWDASVALTGASEAA